MQTPPRLVERFHRVLVDEIHRGAPEYLSRAFTVAEIYQSLIPYRTHRDQLGVEINGDYEDALLRLLAGEGEFLILESEPARNRIRKELQHPNPNTGIYREFAAVGVRLNPERLPEGPDPSRVSGREANGAKDSFSGFYEEETPAGREESAGPRISAPAGVEPLDARGRTDTPLEEDRPIPPAPEGGVTATEETAGAEGPTHCPECDGELPRRESLRFCPHCGTNVLVTPCEGCGELLERAWQFCIACGTPARR